MASPKGSSPFNLDGRTVLVVGGGSGIGAATALLANRLGATVILAGRSAGKLADVRDGLDEPSRAVVMQFDYLDPSSIAAASIGLEVVHHVAIPAVADENAKRGRFLDMPLETMQASFDKFWGSVNVVRAVALRMPPGGSVTLFASVSALKPPAPEGGLSVMNAVHAAVVQLGRSLALELSNVIAPGFVLTNVWTEEKRAELARWMEQSLPARHAGQPEDLAQAAVALMTNPYMTGALQTVDGGVHIT